MVACKRQRPQSMDPGVRRDDERRGQDVWGSLLAEARASAQLRAQVHHGDRRLGRAAALVELAGVEARFITSYQRFPDTLQAFRTGEGDVFVSAGVEAVSRYQNFAGAGGGDESPKNPRFADAMARTEETARTNATWTDPR